MEVTIENIHQWAYDENLHFKNQDEASSFYNPTYIPTLVELAGKKDCPKQERIQSILESYIQESFLKRKTEVLKEINEKLQEIKPFLNTQWLVLWFVNFQYIYNIYQTPQRLTTAACDKIAHDLLIGHFTQRTFKKHGPLKDGALEYSAEATPFKLYLYIHPVDGLWRTSKYLRLLKFDQ
ncbi:hypothetical protein [Aureispira sp. CCB-E]|uniref:hypothetical protein n=1 Tax=Aureispira sp. CCB-E TaxID=3051121 RepID=UPI0028684D00|nr:hypothetical protein [Aureispira sp. CCB-E]WMX12159.1 hypothetical protein QP953_15135 [Aureispira sp. CCB-E]